MEDVKAMLTQMELSTQGVEKPDRLGIPSDVYIALSLRRIDGTQSSVLKYLKDNLPGIKIVQCHELNANSVDTNPYAAAPGAETPGQGVGILYKYDADKLSAEIPMPFLQHPAQHRNLEVEIMCESRIAGVVIYYPMSAMIVVGI